MLEKGEQIEGKKVRTKDVAMAALALAVISHSCHKLWHFADQAEQLKV